MYIEGAVVGGRRRCLSGAPLGVHAEEAGQSCWQEDLNGGWACVTPKLCTTSHSNDFGGDDKYRLNDSYAPCRRNRFNSEKNTIRRV